MFRLPSRLVPAVALLGGSRDIITPTEKAMQEKIKLLAPEETGWDRVKSLIHRDEYGDMSPDLSLITNTTIMGIFIGACYGGYMKSRTVYIDFIEQNKATAFQSHLEAKQKLASKMYISYGKGAWQWSWRIGGFTFLYMVTSCGIALYRGKEGLFEHFAAGSLIGILFRCYLGIPGMIVGGIVGGIGGTIAGAVNNFILWATGTSMKDVKEFNRQWRQTRLELEKKTIGEVKRKEEMHALYLEKIKADENLQLDELNAIVRTDTKQEEQGKQQLAPKEESTVGNANTRHNAQEQQKSSVVTSTKQEYTSATRFVN